MELQGVVSGQRDVESPAEVVGKRAAVVVQEEVVVAQWGHGDAHLSQVVQVLHTRYLQQCTLYR